MREPKGFDEIRTRGSKWFDEKLMPLLMRIAAQRHLAALRDAFMGIIIFMLVGSFFSLILNFPFGVGDYLSRWSDILNVPIALTTGLASVYVSLFLGYALSKSYDMDPLVGSVVALTSFLFIAAPSTGDVLSMTWLGSSGMFVAAIFAIISIEIMRVFYARNWVIKLPPSVPKAVERAFGMIPVLTAISLLCWGIRSALGLDVPGLFVGALTPALSATDSLAGVISWGVACPLQWFFGIHAAALLGGTLLPVIVANTVSNTAAVAGGAAPAYIFTLPFLFSYMMVGGSQNTFTLNLFCLRSKSQRIKKIGQLAFVPALFNINEPMIYGLPLALNPMMLIPFLLASVISGAIAFVVTAAGLVAIPYLMLPWSIPIPLYILLTTNFNIGALLLSIVLGYALPGLIYYPFYKRYERVMVEEEEKKGLMSLNQNTGAEKKG